MGQIASQGQLRMAFVRWALVMVPLVLLLGIASGWLANSGYGNPWFDALRKPAIMPPGRVFAVAWTILYVLMGFALALILSARGARGRGAAIALFVLQLALNLAWSPLFFGAHQVTAALGLILVLILVVAVTMWRFWGIRKLAGLLLLPYLAWLLFAALLNFQILQANPDAESLAPGRVRTQISL
ncbi:MULTISPECIES: TspO/MBR family protein [Sphingomonadales]|uniref:TspO/MBR family protein n=1 Tax=Edaphosphingomonas haloaromaticamans TaxID=653954 RepID=A0A1S1HA11_9SPHN|nr:MULTISPECIES: TspO/MBR family protein [Sphingomonas]AGH50599.1 TspO and MBR-like protein [Sphingomonas sp. MM-1]OHT19029.1 TspO/MBR family protein [Sphingomonas haloaromaticamans]